MRNKQKMGRGMHALRDSIDKQISFKAEDRKEIKPLVNCEAWHRGNVIPKES